MISQGPLTVSATPSLSVKAAAVNEPRVVTALVVPVAPRRLAAAEAEPVRVPAIRPQRPMKIQRRNSAATTVVPTDATLLVERFKD